VERLKGLGNSKPNNSKNIEMPKPVSPAPYQQAQPINRPNTSNSVNPSIPANQDQKVNKEVPIETINQSISIPPPQLSVRADSTNVSHSVPQGISSTNTLSSTPSQSTEPPRPVLPVQQTVLGRTFSGGIKVLNNRMVAATREPALK